MNKKGFISISVVYSFFVVFLLLMLFIVNNLVSNRLLLNSMKAEIKENISDTTFARYLINHAKELGLVHHNADLANGAGDNSYRYTGANPNNYVCFGTDVTPCPSNNLYRIIGVIDGKVKLISNSSVATLAFDTDETNYFINTTIYNYLNTNYLNTLSTYASLIATTNFYTNGITNSLATDTLKNIYENELGNNQNKNIWVNNKIALLYISDYGYGTIQDNYGSTATGADNWLNNGTSYWTISRDNSTHNTAFYINNNGTLSSSTVENTYQIRPVFYLNSTVHLASGEGSQASPYRIEE